MENLPFMLEFSKPLARSALKRDVLSMEIEKTEDGDLVDLKSQLDKIEEKD
jgi:hypothetical protein